MSTSMACESQHAADICVSEPAGQGSELSLVEMTEVEYLQHIIQSHIDVHVSETDSSGLSQLKENLYEEPEKRLACSPHSLLECRPEGTSVCPSDTGPVDLLLLSDSNTTPVSSAEVPGSVLNRVQCVIQNRASERPLEERPSPAARVCLEKRFLSVLCHSTNTSGIPTHAQIEKWSKPDKMVKIQGTYPCEGRLFKPGGQQSELIIPAELTVSFRADKGLEPVRRGPLVNFTDTVDQQTADMLKNGNTMGCQQEGGARKTSLPTEAICEAVDKARHPVSRVRTRPLRSSNIMLNQETRNPYTGMSGTKRCKTGPLMDRTQRKEVHNRKERDRRRRIRLCCDELNLLVPFCYADTDKATTLQWTTAFLKYIQEIHGDRLKQDFQSTFCGKTGLRLKPGCFSVAHLLESYKNATEAADSSSHS